MFPNSPSTNRKELHRRRLAIKKTGNLTEKIHKSKGEGAKKRQTTQKKGQKGQR